MLWIMILTSSEAREAVIVAFTMVLQPWFSYLLGDWKESLTATPSPLSSPPPPLNVLPPSLVSLVVLGLSWKLTNWSAHVCARRLALARWLAGF